MLTPRRLDLHGAHPWVQRRNRAHSCGCRVRKVTNKLDAGLGAKDAELEWFEWGMDESVQKSWS